MVIVTKSEARNTGLLRYFTGKPCKYGHIAERPVGNGQCVECARISRAQRAKDSKALRGKEEIEVNIPECLGPYRDHMVRFFAAMVGKLEKNSHKDTPSRDDIPTIIAKMRREIEEFEEQFAADRTDKNALYELADVSNFALLAYIALQKIRI